MVQGTPNARFDVLFAAPSRTVQLDANAAQPADQIGFLSALNAEFVQARATNPAVGESLPFWSGWLLYLGYELLAECEPRVPVSPDPAGLPRACAIRCHGALIREHQTGQVWIVAESQSVADQIVDQLGQAAPLAGEQPELLHASAEDPARLKQSLERIREYILAGDVFQVNLSRGWQASYAADLNPAATYKQLRESNPSPFAGLFRQGDWAVISSSPERLVKVEDGWVETRPIAGTRRRGSSEATDEALLAELIGHPKERAEHVMLIDLERNDLGRLCEPGSVEVDDLMVLESYAHVHHIVSNVRGRLRSGIRPGDVIAATFPGGTITGCPKVRCMEIIQELEPTGRGAYTGALGYLGIDGRLDLNILIRTIVTHGRHAWFRAGAGIVADSDPDAELLEMQAKARGLLPALGLDTEFGRP